MFNIILSLLDVDIPFIPLIDIQLSMTYLIILFVSVHIISNIGIICYLGYHELKGDWEQYRMKLGRKGGYIYEKPNNIRELIRQYFGGKHNTIPQWLTRISIYYMSIIFLIFTVTRWYDPNLSSMNRPRNNFILEYYIIDISLLITYIYVGVWHLSLVYSPGAMVI